MDKSASRTQSFPQWARLQKLVYAAQCPHSAYFPRIHTNPQRAVDFQGISYTHSSTVCKRRGWLWISGAVVHSLSRFNTGPRIIQMLSPTYPRVIHNFVDKCAVGVDGVDPGSGTWGIYGGQTVAPLGGSPQASGGVGIGGVGETTPAP